MLVWPKVSLLVVRCNPKFRSGIEISKNPGETSESVDVDRMTLTFRKFHPTVSAFQVGATRCRTGLACPVRTGVWWSAPETVTAAD